jgi:hypothetical protein
MMEKRGVIEPGRTPPEDDKVKTAAELGSHSTQRAADAAQESLKQADRQPPPNPPRRDKPYVA